MYAEHREQQLVVTVFSFTIFLYGISHFNFISSGKAILVLKSFSKKSVNTILDTKNVLFYLKLFIQSIRAILKPKSFPSFNELSINFLTIPFFA